MNRFSIRSIRCDRPFPARGPRLLLWTLFFLFSALFAAAPAAGSPQALPEDLTTLSLEDLMNIEVTSASKKAQKLSETASAVFVISQEDIQRSGATTIPEALRMVPGVQVARIDANKWAVSARGFNSRWSNKLLVLMDGRSIYTPSFSGVFWNAQDTLLEDIDRIEVIRGPGAALWGANAVNGVINIITKNAADTRGGLLTAGGGSEERGFGGARYGGSLGEDTDYRIYAKYFNRDDSETVSGDGANDDWQAWRSGFRVDSRFADADTFTVQGDVYDGDAGGTYGQAFLTPPYSAYAEADIDMRGFNLIGRWQHIFSGGADVTLQAYYDRYEREESLSGDAFKLTYDTVDIDFQNRFELGERQEILWGAGYRFIQDKADNVFSISLDPDNRDLDVFNIFLQDEITLIPDRLRLTLGAKLEKNDYTDFEFQPNLRLMWTPSSAQSVWAAVSRAVRTPSRIENDVRLNTAVVSRGPFAPPLEIALFGNRDLDAEKLTAYELGYRFQPINELSFDIAVFYNDYDDLIGVTVGAPFLELSPAPLHEVLPLMASNNQEGETYGFELAADWQPTAWWSLKAAYTYLQLSIEEDAIGFAEYSKETIEGSSPEHQVSLRSAMRLTDQVGLDVWLRYVDDLPAFDIDRYVTADMRLSWTPLKNVELAVVGQNLLDDQHPEFVQEGILPTEVERSAYAKVTWRF